MSQMNARASALVFFAFAFAYFFSALIRAITATLAPQLTQEFELLAGDLGLLAGGYFLGFAAMQLPLGQWLDRQGPKKVILGFLTVAVVGCVTFAVSTSFTGLLMARVLSGIGLAACLMAPLTGYRRWFEPAQQLRANSWMLMTGSMGMVASTLPVQWLLPQVGWRPIFWMLALFLIVSMVVIVWQVPDWKPSSHNESAATTGSYREIWRNHYFRRMTPLGFINYGGLVAIQTLWAIPWMVRVADFSPVKASASLFILNSAMLMAFWAWGLGVHKLAHRGWPVDRLIAWGTPLSMVVLGLLAAGGGGWGEATAWLLLAFCVSSTVISLAQPSVGMAFPPDQAGRALSAYNLVIFAGVFVVQWGIGLLIDAGIALGWDQAEAFRMALGIHLVLSIAAYMYFMMAKRDNQHS